MKSWSGKDFASSIIVHCIKNDAEEQPKKLLLTWKFLSLLVEFFVEKHNYGKEFVAKYIQSDTDKDDKSKEDGKPTRGYGLAILEEICKQYDQKQGKYAKVKRHLGNWCKQTIKRYKQEIDNKVDDPEEDTDTDEDEDKDGDGDGDAKNPTDALPSPVAKDSNNKKWYWYRDEGGKIEWIPYKDEHQKIINNAWENDKLDVIIMEKFKIDFQRGHGGSPSGQQYDCQRFNSWRRPVIYGEPNQQGLLRDIMCRKQPK